MIGALLLLGIFGASGGAGGDVDNTVTPIGRTLTLSDATTAEEAIFAQPIDPSDTVDFVVNLVSGAHDADPAPFLIGAEAVASFTLQPAASAAALGLIVAADAPYPDPDITGGALKFWLKIDPASRSDPAFDGDGALMGVELTATTNTTPPRIKQRTVAARVRNR